MKKITLLFALLISSIGFSQTYDLLESFNGTGLEGTFGGTTAAYDADPTSASTQVVKITSTSGTGEVWQGINVVLTSNYTLTSATQLSMQMDVYSTTAITIAPKAQGGVSGAPNAVTSVDHTGSGWETLTFTFDKTLDGQGPANGNYSDFALHINWNTAGNAYGAPDGRVFYIKNLKGLGVAAPPGPTPPTTAPANPPARNAWDVISLFSDAYTPTAITNFDAGWCGSGSVEEVDINGNKILLWKSNPCQGIEMTPINATAFTHMHLDLYIAEGTDIIGKVFNLKFVDTADNNVLEVNFNQATSPALEAGKWITIDVPVNLAAFDKLNQFGITSGNLNNLAWYDNLYFYRAATASTENNELLGFSMYPSPAKNSLTISAKGTIQNADVFNVLGKKVSSFTVNKTKETLDVSNLATGIYLVKY
ncbi:MAG: T9SS type A sorting domain-containing protein, partial [Polaribacter sp.]|nr:T9SS type A sorting domain-containing protein [Polaribacter sp.]